MFVFGLYHNPILIYVVIIFILYKASVNWEKQMSFGAQTILMSYDISRSGLLVQEMSRCVYVRSIVVGNWNVEYKLSK